MHAAVHRDERDRLLLYISLYRKFNCFLIGIISMYNNRLEHRPFMRIGFHLYFYLPTAAGRDLLCRKEGSGTASTGLYLVYFKNAFSAVYKGKYMR